MQTQQEQLLNERLKTSEKYCARAEWLSLFFGFLAFFEFCYIIFTRVG